MRLTAEQQQEIRTLYATGNVTQRELGARFGVLQTGISRIIRTPPRACAGCGTPLVGKTRCESCNTPHMKEQRKRWEEKHKEQRAQATRERQKENQHYKEQHNRASREYERRQAAKKRGEHIA